MAAIETFRVPTDKAVVRLDTRVGDIELAVLELAGIVERLVVADAKRWKGSERRSMLLAVDAARALATPEGGDDDDDPEPEPPATLLGAPVIECDSMPDGLVAIANNGEPRYWIDLTSGDGEATDDFDRIRRAWRAGDVRHATDRLLGDLVIYNGRWQGVGAPCDASDAA